MTAAAAVLDDPDQARGRLRVGYLREGLEDDGVAALAKAQCQVVRAESRASQWPGPVLQAILGFLGRGDSLVVPSLQSLGSVAAVLSTLQALGARGVILEVLDPPFSTAGEAGYALAAGLSHVTPAPRTGLSAKEVQVLHEAGLGPSEIARRLGVSRMTVWRKLRR